MDLCCICRLCKHCEWLLWDLVSIGLWALYRHDYSYSSPVAALAFARIGSRQGVKVVLTLSPKHLEGNSWCEDGILKR